MRSLPLLTVRRRLTRAAPVRGARSRTCAGGTQGRLLPRAGAADALRQRQGRCCESCCKEMRVAAPGRAVFLRPAKAGRFCRGSSLVPERSLPLGSVLAVLVGAPANTVKPHFCQG